MASFARKESVVKPLDPPDSFYLEAAKGWLGLGDFNAASEELEKIAASSRTHPDVLAVQCEIWMRAKKWDHVSTVAEALVKFVPDEQTNWINRSFALHALNRTQEAFDLLLPAKERFPASWHVHYNLACYLVRLCRLREGEVLLNKAIDLGDPKAVKTMAFNDPDLKSLWASSVEI